MICSKYKIKTKTTFRKARKIQSGLSHGDIGRRETVGLKLDFILNIIFAAKRATILIHSVTKQQNLSLLAPFTLENWFI